MNQPYSLLASTIAVLSLCVLNGCATRTPETCDANTWHERGFTQALTGKTDEPDSAQHDCATKHAPLAYHLGLDDGLEKYCTFEKGLMVGEMGQGPADSCTDPKWDEYQTGYVMGHQISQVNARLEAITTALDVARNHLWELEQAGQTKNSPSIKAKMAQIEQLMRERAQASETLMNLKANIH